MPTSKNRKNPVGTSSVADFKKRTGGLTTLPSGLVVKLKNKGGMRAFMASGVIPNSLMTIIQEAIAKGSAPDMGGVIKPDGSMDEDMVSDMLLLTDRVVLETLVSPEVYPVPGEAEVKEYNRTHPKNKIDDPDELRDDNKLYIDDIDEEDKMFIFQWVTGGTQDVERFRQELASTMDDLAGQQNLQGKTKSAGGARRR